MGSIGVEELRMLVKRIRRDRNYYRDVGDKEKEREEEIRMRLVYNQLSYINRRIDLKKI